MTDKTVIEGTEDTGNRRLLDFEAYQDFTDTTAIYPGKGTLLGLCYAVLGLNGEAGELAEKLKKVIRDTEGKIDQAKRVEILKELGDVLWYTARIATELEGYLGDVAQENINKLISRKDRDVIGGSGDNR